MQKKILLLAFAALVMAGCATSTRYTPYTYERFPPKDPYYAVSIYPESQALPSTRPYYVIGKVSVEGFASYGVTPETLNVQAEKIARRRGADAIINGRTEVIHYFADALLRFKGELIVYAPTTK